MSCCKKNSCFCLMLTLFRCPLITEHKHLLRDPELSSVTRNCQIYIMPLDTLQIGIYKLKYLMNCIKVKRNNLLNSIYSSVSPDIRFQETPYVNFFTDPELSSSLYEISNNDHFHWEPKGLLTGDLQLNIAMKMKHIKLFTADVPSRYRKHIQKEKHPVPGNINVKNRNEKLATAVGN